MARSAATAAAPIRSASRCGLRDCDRDPGALGDQQLRGGQADSGAATGHQHPEIAKLQVHLNRHHMMVGMTQLLVARHGETDWNREGRWQGHGGPGLNETGRRQA